MLAKIKEFILDTYNLVNFDVMFYFYIFLVSVSVFCILYYVSITVGWLPAILGAMAIYLIRINYRSKTLADRVKNLESELDFRRRYTTGPSKVVGRRGPQPLNLRSSVWDNPTLEDPVRKATKRGGRN